MDVLGKFVRLERVGDQRPGHDDEVVSLQLGGQTHAVVGRNRVGAGEHHVALDVQTDEPVADPRAGPRHRQVADVRERALGEHVLQILRTVEVGDLQRAGLFAGGHQVW